MLIVSPDFLRNLEAAGKSAEYRRVVMTQAASLGLAASLAGEAAWTARVDNTFGQPSAKA